MRKFLIPTILLLAVGAVVVVLVLLNREGKRKPGDDVPRPEVAGRESAPPTPEAGHGLDLTRPKTRTSVAENANLSDLQLFLERHDIPRALYFRGRVCEELDTILESEKLTRDLLETIRTLGIESDDLAQRDVLLPMLRVLRHPEATAMVEQEYYRARNNDERIMLLEAMSHSYHNPERAGAIAVERALNAETHEERYHAFDVIRSYSEDEGIIFKTACAIFEGTTRQDQASLAIEVIANFAWHDVAAQTWLRGRLKKAQLDELNELIGKIDTWGDESDAAQLEQLAEEFPAMGPVLFVRARRVRENFKMRQDAAEAGRGHEIKETTPPNPNREKKE